MTHRLLLATLTPLLLLSGWTGVCLLPVASALAEEEAAAPAEPKPEFDPAHAEKMQEGLKLFKEKVRGVLIEACVDCHGGAEVESQFDLATRKGLLRGGAEGPAIVAGKSVDSHLLRLIQHKEKPEMPQGGDKLPDDAIAAIARWIDLGAPYDRPLVENPRDPDSWVDQRIDPKAREFWAFQPLRTASPPPISAERATWARTPVDAFVLAKQQEKGVTANPLATRARLIRRAYLDLIGLPPTREEVERFVADPDPEAYGKLIDQLLDSPHYGERWGRHWLDVARFAESHGFEQDYDRPYAYHYRDFVIRALNQDMPYDQFVRWQLAGDELAPDDPLALMATGFLGAGVFPTQITLNEVERTRYDALDDMASTTTSAFLGLTVGCARCHDHKFDPIPQGDYYRFAAIFTTTVRSNIDVNLKPAEYKLAKAAFDAEHAPLVAAREAYEQNELPARLLEWEKTPAAEAARSTSWIVVDPVESKSAGGATFTRQPDGSLLVGGPNADFDTYTFTIQTPLRGITGLRIEPMAHPSLVAGGPGRAANGNIALTDLRVTAAPLAGGEAQAVGLKNPRATFEQPGLLVAYAIDDNPKSAWALDPQFGKDHAAVFELESPIDHDGGAKLTVTLKFENNKQHNIGRLRLSLTQATGTLPLNHEGIAPDALAALLTSPAERTEAQKQALLAWYRQYDDGWLKLDQAVRDHAAKEPKPELVKVMVCSEGVTPIRHHTQGADFFNETYYLKRGDCDQKQGVAEPDFLQVLTKADGESNRWRVEPPPGSKLSYRRTALANWITDTEHGAGQLLARVIVNRLWQQHFGVGIVSTPNDFGVQGAKPTHPELLDWLAAELIRGGWRLKPMHKLLMTSAVYMQSSEYDEADAKIDPDNELLWRFEPRRLEAEIIRDQMLAVSGTLDRTMFGPGSLDEGHKRRSIYFMIKRSKLIPTMQLFDQPEPLVSVGGRPATTIAPQALVLMNNPNVRQYARNFGGKLVPAANTSLANAVSEAYWATLGRAPDEVELADSVAFLESQEKSYQANNQPNPRELALADFCQALFGLNEFVYVE